MRSLVAKAEALQRVPATLPVAAALPMTAFARRIALNLMRCCHCEAVKSYASYYQCFIFLSLPLSCLRRCALPRERGTSRTERPKRI